MELERLIKLFKDVKPAPRTAQVDRTSHTEAIRLQFIEATALLKTHSTGLPYNLSGKTQIFT